MAGQLNGGSGDDEVFFLFITALIDDNLHGLFH